jgi:hypothetical protein
MTITLRKPGQSGRSDIVHKGDVITHLEMDNNFEHLVSVDDSLAGRINILENSSGINLTAPSAELTFDINTGELTYTQGDTDTVAEGTTNLYYTDERTRSAISVSGDLTYDSATGVIGYTPDLTNYYTKSEVDTEIAGISGGGGSYTNSDVDTHLNVGVQFGALEGQILSWTGTDYDWINYNITDGNNVGLGHEHFWHAGLYGFGGTGAFDANTAIGNGAMKYANPANQSSDIEYNTAIGAGALSGSSAYNSGANVLQNFGSHNTVIGADAGQLIQGINNIVLGSNAGSGSDYKTGDRNIYIGTFAGRNTTSGSNNIFIGNQAGYYETGSNKLHIASHPVTPSGGTTLIGGDFSTGNVTFNDAYTFPAADGTANQVLKTDGSGELSWSPTNLPVLEVDVTNLSSDSANPTTMDTSSYSGVYISGSVGLTPSLKYIEIPNSTISGKRFFWINVATAGGGAPGSGPVVLKINGSQNSGHAEGEYVWTGSVWAKLN